MKPGPDTDLVYLSHMIELSWAEVDLLKLPMGEQHGTWQWLALAQQQLGWQAHR